MNAIKGGGKSKFVRARHITMKGSISTKFGTTYLSVTAFGAILKKNAIVREAQR